MRSGRSRRRDTWSSPCPRWRTHMPELALQIVGGGGRRESWRHAGTPAWWSSWSRGTSDDGRGMPGSRRGSACRSSRPQKRADLDDYMIPFPRGRLRHRDPPAGTIAVRGALRFELTGEVPRQTRSRRPAAGRPPSASFSWSCCHHPAALRGGEAPGASGGGRRVPGSTIIRSRCGRTAAAGVGSAAVSAASAEAGIRRFRRWWRVRRGGAGREPGRGGAGTISVDSARKLTAELTGFGRPVASVSSTARSPGGEAIEGVSDERPRPPGPGRPRRYAALSGGAGRGGEHPLLMARGPSGGAPPARSPPSFCRHEGRPRDGAWRGPAPPTDVDPVELRLQAEHELRGKLLQLRGAWSSPERTAISGRLLLRPARTTYPTALRLAGSGTIRPRMYWPAARAHGRGCGASPARLGGAAPARWRVAGRPTRHGLPLGGTHCRLRRT